MQEGGYGMGSETNGSIRALTAIILIAFAASCCGNRNMPEIRTLPNLPRPIAGEAALITSAGQSTDTYIIRDIANRVMINNLFMPQAKETNMDDIGTLVIVVGYSSIGLKSQGISYDEEKERILELVDRAKSKDLTVLTLYIGGKQRRGFRTDELLRLVSSRTDYLIGIREADYDGFLTELAGEYDFPLTLVRGVGDLKEPFASAFR